jgi:large subunit ribosomal protein L15e
MAQWRREPVNCRIERPTRLDAARSLGYKAKQGVVLIRTRIRRGGLRKGKIHMKRKPSKAGIKKITMAKNTQRMAEERVARHFPNLEVLNSYWVGQDGKHKFYEVIMIDTHHPAIIKDKQLGVFCGAKRKQLSPWTSLPWQDLCWKARTRSAQQGEGRREVATFTQGKPQPWQVSITLI